MTTVTELYITNLFLGLAGATNEAIVGVTIADLFFVHQRGTMNGFYLIMVLSGSFLTPILAGVQATEQSWRWSYYLLSIFTGVILILFAFFYEETKYIPTSIGQQPARTGGADEAGPVKRDPEDTVTAVDESYVAADIRWNERVDQIIPMNTWRQRLRMVTYTPDPLIKLFYAPFVVLYTFPTVMFSAIQYGSGLCWLLNLSVTISTVYPYPPYNFTAAAVGYMGIGPFIGNLIGSVYSGYLADRFIVWMSRRNKGFYEPEMRLYLLHLPSISMCGGLIMFGISTAKVITFMLRVAAAH